MKFSFKYYYCPTPKTWRKVGDSVLGSSIFLTSSSLIMNWHWLGLSALLLGSMGKFLTNFFSEDPPANQIEQSKA
jgi:hypothetical protein